jgi:GDP-L-fucose synthase
MTDFFQGKRVALPGGKGFLGGFLSSRLKELGAKVTIPEHNNPWDFTQWEHAVKFFNADKFDLVINCAANQGGIAFHKGRQAELYWDNVRMTGNLLQAAFEAKVPKFVNLVPGCAYPGYLEKDELLEEDFWQGPVHDSIFSYGYARKFGTVHGLALQKQYGFNSIHLVLANLYGPGEHFNPDQSKALAGMLLKFYNAKKNQQPEVEIWGTGKPIRDWLYVKDAVEYILKAAEIYNSVEILNVASGVGISIKELAEAIQQVTGFEGSLKYNTDKPDGALKKTFSVRKMKQVLGEFPVTPLETGISETAEWLDKNYEFAIKH